MSKYRHPTLTTGTNNYSNQDSVNQLPGTSLIDASPLPTLSVGSPPATGTYALSLGAAQATQAACLTNQSFAAAWSCNIPSPETVAIIIQQQGSGSSSAEGATLLDESNFDSYTNFSYGTQAPTTSFSQFIGVTDYDAPSRGPAFYFSAYYNKLVIVEESAFPAGVATANEKRQGWSYSDLDQWTQRKQIAAGSKPWFCYWNGTFLEGFIYSQDKAVTANTSSATSTRASSSTAALSITSSGPSYTPSSSTLFTTTVSGASTTATLTAAASTSVATPESSTLAAFGYVVKIQERRLENSEAAPYCQQMQILDDGSAGLLTDIDGNVVSFALPETDPSYSAYASAYASASPSSTGTPEYIPGGCLCQWWSGT